MSEIFPKIDLKFYYNITTYNQTNEYMSNSTVPPQKRRGTVPTSW